MPPTETKAVKTVKLVERFAISAGIALAFLSGIILLLVDKTASGIAAATLAIFLILLRNLPILESLEGFTLKAKFRSQVNEAEKIIGLLRTQALAAARSKIEGLARLGQWDAAPSWYKIQQDVDETTRHLTELGVSEETIISINKPVLIGLSNDLARLGINVIASRGGDIALAMSADLTPGNQAVLGPKVQAFFNHGNVSTAAILEGKTRDVRGLLQGVLDGIAVPPNDRAALQAVVEEIGEKVDRCWEASKLLLDATTYATRYAPGAESRLTALHLGPPDKAAALAELHLRNPPA